VSTPIDAVLASVQRAVAGAQVSRLAVTHPADDDNVWFIGTASGKAEVQIDSHPNGQPPFLIEIDQQRPVTALTVGEAVDVIERWLLAAE
jgi:hypothetical protein